MTFPVPRHAALSALALAVVSTFSSIAQAQNAAEPALAAVLVTAARAPQAGVDVIADHVVISAEDIERSGATNVIDLLQKQRGIEVTRNGGPGASSQVFIRGGDARQSVVLIDGVRIGSSTTGIANWAALPIANLERIEIIYGPLATMYGADAIGGVVQIFTRRGAGPASVRAAAMVGSDGARSGAFALNGATAGEHSIHYAFGLSQEEDDGFSSTRPGLSSYNADKDGYTRDSFSGQLGIALAKGHEAGLMYQHNHLKAQYDTAAAFNSRSVQNLDNVAVYSRHVLSDDWRLSLQASEADDQALTIANGTATGTTSISTRQHNYSVQNDIAFGSDLLQVILERREEDVVSSNIKALTTGRATNSIAAAYTLKRGKHLGSASVRRDDSSVYGAETTGGLGYGYRISNALRLNASAGTSFRAPTFNELYFPGFGVASNKPEKGKNVETGIYYSQNSTEISAVYYRNRLTDLLVNTGRCPVEVATHPTGCAYNVAEATLEGVSIGGRTRIGTSIGNVDLHGSLDFQDPRDDTTGNSLVRRARRHAKLGAEYTAGPLVAGLAVQATGRRFDDAANRNALGGYGLVNLYASYQLAADWSAVVKLNNVADKQYETARFYNTAGRQVFAGIRYGVR